MLNTYFLFSYSTFLSVTICRHSAMITYDIQKLWLTLLIRPLPVNLCGTVRYCQSTSVNQKYFPKAGTSVSNGGSCPASKRSTLIQGSSESLLATTDPAVPAPTLRKV